MTDQAGARGATNSPWNRAMEEDLVPASLGGHVGAYSAVVALNIGDQVFLSAANAVTKSTTSADYDAAIGVVVGGQALDMYEVSPYQVGIPAAAINELVYVAWAGKVRVPAEGAITAASVVGSSEVTAGAVKTPPTAVTPGRTTLALTAAVGGEVDILLPYIT